MPVDGRQELSNGTEIQPAIGSCVPNCIGFGRCPFLFLLSMEFRVVEMNGEIIVANDDFRAVYYKPDRLNPQLILKRRTETEDPALLARAWIAAKEKARELGWIV